MKHAKTQEKCRKDGKIKNRRENTIVLKLEEVKMRVIFEKLGSKSLLTDRRRSKIVKNDVSRETF